MGIVGPWWARVPSKMCGGIQNVFAIRVEVAARSSAHTCRFEMHIGAVCIHYEDLVALVGLPCGHEDDATSVIAEVGLGVLPAESQLLYILEVLFARVTERISRRAMAYTSGNTQARRRRLVLPQRRSGH